MSNRKTVTVDGDAHAKLAAHKDPSESWSDVFSRAADALSDSESEHTLNTVAVENVDEIARRTASEVEDRMTRR